MVWWIRFKLGLPARKTDIRALRRDIPELFHQHFNLQDRNFWSLPDFEMESSEPEFWNTLRNWVSSYDKQREKAWIHWSQIQKIAQQNSAHCGKLNLRRMALQLKMKMS
jgi:hypothetical protein